MSRVIRDLADAMSLEQRPAQPVAMVQPSVWDAARQSLATMPYMEHGALCAIHWPTAILAAKERIGFARNVESAVRSQLSTAIAQALAAHGIQAGKGQA